MGSRKELPTSKRAMPLGVGRERADPEGVAAEGDGAASRRRGGRARRGRGGADRRPGRWSESMATRSSMRMRYSYVEMAELDGAVAAGEQVVAGGRPGGRRGRGRRGEVASRGCWRRRRPQRGERMRCSCAPSAWVAWGSKQRMRRSASVAAVRVVSMAVTILGRGRGRGLNFLGWRASVKPARTSGALRQSRAEASTGGTRILLREESCLTRRGSWGLRG